METALITLTVLSFAAAAGFAAAAWRTRAEQQRRSAARVAALASTLNAADPASSEAVEPVPVASLFQTSAGATVNRRLFTKPIIVTAVAVTMIVLAGMALRSGDSVEDGHATAPLELISMRHTRDGDTLTVTGLVRNPPTGAPLTRVAAVVFAFDRSGGFVASARATLDFLTLAPGDESPFVVTVPDLAEVGRYRVSFRTEEGLLRHIDRRGKETGFDFSGRQRTKTLETSNPVS